MPSLAQTSTVDVLPPYWFVSAPGAASDPRVPKSVTRRRFEIGQHRYCGGKVGSPWPIMLNFALCSSLSEA